MTPRFRLIAGLLLGVPGPALLWALGLGIPWIAAHLSVLVALIFLLVPRWLEPEADPEERARPHTRTRAALLSLGLLILLLPLFLVGHHIWMHSIQGWSASPAPSAWVQLPDSIRGAAPTHQDALSLSRHDGRLHLRWAPPEGGTLHLQTDADVIPLHPGTALEFQRAETEPGTWQWTLAATDALHLSFATRGGTHLYLDAADQGGHLPPGRYLLGESAFTPRPGWQHDTGWRLPLGLSWMLLLLLVHVIVIAIPEEIFFRGFLQRQFERNGASAPLISFRGWTVTRANVWTSVAFALGHGLIGLDPLRLAVFFPSLAFGALRDRTGGLVAPVIFHVGCNLLVAFTLPHYLPIG